MERSSWRPPFLRRIVLLSPIAVAALAAALAAAPARLAAIPFALALGLGSASAAVPASPTAPTGMTQPPLARTLLDLVGDSWGKDRPVSGLSGRLTWGDGGAIRIVLVLAPGSPSGEDSTLKVQITNEGTLGFTLQPRDRWSIVMTDGRRMALERLQKIENVQIQEPKVTLGRYESATVLLVAGKPIGGEAAILEYRSQMTGSSVEIRHSWTGPKPRLVVAPGYPSGVGIPPTEAIREAGILAYAVVGPDGRVEGVFMARAAQGPMLDRMREAVLKAFFEWEFEPAVENGVPQRTVYEKQFVFSKQRVARATFPIPGAKIESRLRPLLSGAFGRIVPLPLAKGFVIAGKPGGDEKVRGARAVMVRYGEDPAGGSSWIAVASTALFTQAKGAPCGCERWEPQEGVPEKILEWLAAGLDVRPSSRVVLAPQGDRLIPSGYPEPIGAGVWSKGVIRSLLRTSLAEGGADGAREGAAAEGIAGEAEAQKPAVGIEAQVPPIPAESEFLDNPEPVKVTGEVRAPELVSRTSPDYLEAARMAGIEGQVILAAVIGTNGEVVDLRVLKSLPLLDRAAMDAVCCWKYKPATMQGRPVRVLLPVVVDFAPSHN